MVLYLNAKNGVDIYKHIFWSFNHYKLTLKMELFVDFEYTIYNNNGVLQMKTPKKALVSSAEYVK